MTTATTTRTLKTDLINEFYEYRTDHNRHVSPYNTPTARAEAGRHLKEDDPLAAFAKMAPEDWEDVPYWATVHYLITTALGGEPTATTKLKGEISRHATKAAALGAATANHGSIGCETYVVACVDAGWLVTTERPMFGEWYTYDGIRHG